MDLQLGGKRALVTGSTAGIGFAAAARLAEEGASVVINGRSKERVEEAVRRARERAPEAEVFGVASDLGTGEGVEELVCQVPETDILVYDPKYKQT
jgi:NAD(P)-dependent dehydrogenase (short-subunit alcohol dehydrogenase family)